MGPEYIRYRLWPGVPPPAGRTLQAKKMAKTAHLGTSNCLMRSMPKTMGYLEWKRGQFARNSSSTSRYDQITILVLAGPLSGLAGPAYGGPTENHQEKSFTEKLCSSKTVFTKVVRDVKKMSPVQFFLFLTCLARVMVIWVFWPQKGVVYGRQGGGIYAVGEHWKSCGKYAENAEIMRKLCGFFNRIFKKDLAKFLTPAFPGEYFSRF